jgi:putative peptidoglycan lipid II flippase
MSELAGARSITRSARWVAAGIFFSRLAGLGRTFVMARFLGTSEVASAFTLALRMPNVLQNLLGEGTLSASFIPVYARLLEEGREEEAGRVAGAIFALIFALSGALALLGIFLAPVLVSIFLPGATGALRELTIAGVRIIFPMTGILVLSAWALGILNSHRHFFISYAAPVLWNVAIIAALLIYGGRLEGLSLMTALSWGALAGGVLQFAIQLPWVISLERNLRIRWSSRLEGVRVAVKNAGPAILGRGSVQLSGWLDMILISFLWAGAASVMGYAQTFYLLPISLFGMSIAAAELPEFSRRAQDGHEVLQGRLNSGLRMIAFYVTPSVIAYLVLGKVIIAALLEHGDFDANDTLIVYQTLAGYSVGLLASTASRLYSNVFYALSDTRTPARFAIVRVALTGLLGLALMLPLEQVRLRGIPLGVVGLALGSGISSWIEWGLLRRSLGLRLGTIGAGRGPLIRMLAAALIAALMALGIGAVLPPLSPIVRGALILTPFGVIYFLMGHLLGLTEARSALGRIRQRLGG